MQLQILQCPPITNHNIVKFYPKKKEKEKKKKKEVDNIYTTPGQIKNKTTEEYCT